MTEITPAQIMKSTRVKLSTDAQARAEWVKMRDHQRKVEEVHQKWREQNRTARRLFLLIIVFWAVVGLIAVILF